MEKMTLLAIVLSGEIGERIFIGCFIALVTAIYFAISDKIKKAKEEKREEQRQVIFKREIEDKGGLWKIKPKLYEYLKEITEVNNESKLGISIYMMFGNNYEITASLSGEKYEILYLGIDNLKSSKKKDRDKILRIVFLLSDTDSYIIETIQRELHKTA